MAKALKLWNAYLIELWFIWKYCIPLRQGTVGYTAKAGVDSGGRAARGRGT